MPDPIPTPDAPLDADPAEGTPAAPSAGNDGDSTPPAPAAGPGSDAWKDVPDFAQREVSDLRQENARRRQNEKTLKEQLEASKSQEDIDAAIAAYSTQVTELEANLARERAGRGLSDEARQVLASVPADKVEEVAAALAALTTGSTPPQTPPDPNAGDPLRGGLGGDNSAEDEVDGGSDMKAYLAKKRR